MSVIVMCLELHGNNLHNHEKLHFASDDFVGGFNAMAKWDDFWEMFDVFFFLSSLRIFRLQLKTISFFYKLTSLQPYQEVKTSSIGWTSFPLTWRLSSDKLPIIKLVRSNVCTCDRLAKETEEKR